jgi:hypothetical protein
MPRSLYTFRCLIDYKSKGADRVQKQNALLTDIGIDIDFSNAVSVDIRNKCKELGLNGWVISPFWSPDIDETWYNTWYDLQKNGEGEQITDFFRKDDYKLLNHIRGYIRFEVEKYDWLTEADDLFNTKNYFGCTLILAAILEREIRKCPIDNWRCKTTCYFKDSVTDKIIQIYHDDKIEPISRYIDTLLLLPSLDGFIESFYNSGYTFENKVEPDFLERNWLMHGMTNRRISEVDCIRLFNVIGTLCYVLHALFGTDYRH